MNIEIDKYCKNKKIKWFASVWDLNSAYELKEISKLIKIPSAKLTDKKLCAYVNKTINKKYYLQACQNSLRLIVYKNIKTKFLMHTISTYPSPVNELNLNSLYNILSLSLKIFNLNTILDMKFGLSTTFAAVGLGASWIERHITLDRHMWGSDQLRSVEPAGLFQLMSGIRAIVKVFRRYKTKELLQIRKV